MSDKFYVWYYVKARYGEGILLIYEKLEGFDGLDKLWACKNMNDVDELLQPYCK